MKNALWLGRQDSNLGMGESKSPALPLGYAPTAVRSTGQALTTVLLNASQVMRGEKSQRRIADRLDATPSDKQHWLSDRIML
jgi:hypothetical protein